MTDAFTSGVVEGLAKTGAPRWYREIKRSPDAFKSLFPHGESAVGAKYRKAMKRLSNMDRKKLQLGLGIDSSRVNIHDLSMSDPIRRAAYFKKRGKHHKIVGSLERGAIGREGAAKGIAMAAERARTGKTVAPYKVLGSKRLINVEHLSMDPEGLKAAKNVRTPSAAGNRMPIQTVYAFKSRSPSRKLFSGGSKELKPVRARVPESRVVYGPNTVGGKDPEIMVPGPVFKRGIK